MKTCLFAFRLCKVNAEFLCPARGVDNLFGNKNLLYKNNWRVEVAKCDNSREDGDGEREGGGGEM